MSEPILIDQIVEQSGSLIRLVRKLAALKGKQVSMQTKFYQRGQRWKKMCTIVLGTQTLQGTLLEIRIVYLEDFEKKLMLLLKGVEIDKVKQLVLAEVDFRSARSA